MDVSRLVTVIITTHNRALLLPRAIDSVLAQTYKNIEIIIVNDCSIDNTEEVVQHYMNKHENIKHIKHQKALGGNAARNSGVRAASGEFIAGLDDDDEFTPDRIEVLIENYSDEYSLITTRSIIIRKTHKEKTKYIPEVSLNTILYFNAIGNQVLVKRDNIIGAGLFDENLIRYQDYDMWLRIIEKYGKAKTVNKVTQIMHYEHDVASNNTIKNNFVGAFSFYKKHRHLMTKSQKKMHLFIIFKLRNKRLTLKKMRLFLTFNSYKSILKYFIIGH